MSRFAESIPSPITPVLAVEPGADFQAPPTGVVEAHREVVGRLLKAIGYPTAWVSDFSVVNDFALGDAIDSGRMRQSLSREFGVYIPDEVLDWEFQRFVPWLLGGSQ